MKMTVFILLLAVFLPVEFAVAKTMEEAVDFNLSGRNNETVTLSSYREKQQVLLFFWTTWCPFCRGELKLLGDKYPQLVKDGLELLAIDVGEPADKVDNFLKKRAIAFKVLLDRDTRVAYAYNILGVPAYILVDKEGYIVFTGNRFPRNYKDLLSE